jgi:hypothetical protein
MIKQPILQTSATLFIFIMTSIITFMLTLITFAIKSSTHYKTSIHSYSSRAFQWYQESNAGQRSSRDKERKQKTTVLTR